ncbi:hypothetical protein AX15_007314 [Amanita polypyramis BW_CC]|nr:hypothetical protein AX15_007314 [Amanita polypyramis BW_CC]
MDNPRIVHFTGTVNPTVGEILNTFLQPPTAKPWGYIGSPGHPYQREWWEVLERTQWKSGEEGSFGSSVIEIQRKEASLKAASEGLAEFHRTVEAFINENKRLPAA